MNNPDNQLIFSIAKIYKEEEGKMEEFHLEVEQDFDEEGWKRITPINTDVSFMKTEKAIVAMLEDFTCDLEGSCCRCTKKMEIHLEIPLITRDFLFKKPEVVEDNFDLFLVDLKQMEVDLFEVFRQEILLHFPAFPVCSPSCKGVCPVCGKDKNKAECGHSGIEKVDAFEPKVEIIHPFENLKNIIKNDNS